MNTSVAKWLAEVDNFIKTTSREEKERIWIEVKEMNLKGPSIFAYFNDLFENQPLDLVFDKSITTCDNSPPPLRPYNLIKETPKYSLEFFLYNC